MNIRSQASIAIITGSMVWASSAWATAVVTLTDRVTGEPVSVDCMSTDTGVVFREGPKGTYWTRELAPNTKYMVKIQKASITPRVTLITDAKGSVFLPLGFTRVRFSVRGEISGTGIGSASIMVQQVGDTVGRRRYTTTMGNLFDPVAADAVGVVDFHFLDGSYTYEIKLSSLQGPVIAEGEINTADGKNLISAVVPQATMVSEMQALLPEPILGGTSNMCMP